MRYRIYFNRVEDAPQIWSFDEGTTATEVNVQNVVVRVPMQTGARLDAEYPEPKAWQECNAAIRIEGGVAYFDAVTR